MSMESGSRLYLNRSQDGMGQPTKDSISQWCWCEWSCVSGLFCAFLKHGFSALGALLEIRGGALTGAGDLYFTPLIISSGPPTVQCWDVGTVP